MQFLVADWPDGDPNQSEVETRVAGPTDADVRAALFRDREIHYGTHFILYGSQVGELCAICTSGPYAAPGDAGAFLLSIDGEVVAESATRDAAAAHLCSGLIPSPGLTAV